MFNPVDVNHANNQSATIHATQYQAFEHPPAYTPYKPPLSQAVHNQTIKLMNFATQLSSPVQGSMKAHHASHLHAQNFAAAPQMAKPSYNFDFSDKSVKLFNSETHVVHKNDDKTNAEKEKDNTGTRVLVGIIGLIGAGVAAFFLGKAAAVGEDAKEEKENFEDLKGHWNVHKDCYAADYQFEMSKVIRKAETCLKRKETNRIHKIALLAFSFISGAMAVTGAFLGSTGLMLGAAAVGSCVIIAALFRLGYNCYSNRDQKDVQAIQNAIGELQKMKLVIQG